MNTTVRLTGLDGGEPLGFLAALGVLRVVDDRRATGTDRPRLRFADEGVQVPELLGPPSIDTVVETILQDAALLAESVPLSFAYDEAGERCDVDHPGAARDLKPAPAAARELLKASADASRIDADLATALLSDVARDKSRGRAKPTAFHFTAGQQAFLGMAESLRRGIDAVDCTEALCGPWRRESSLPSMGWDTADLREYALRASNPSKEKRGSVAAAHWLGIRALGFFPVHARGRDIVTAAVHGRWFDGVFAWPLWNAALTVPVVTQLLQQDVVSWSAQQRAARRVQQVLGARINRARKYGTFSPARVLLPGEHPGRTAASVDVEEEE